MVLPVISQKRMKWSKIATALVPFGAYRRTLRGIIWMGVGEYIRRRRAEKNLKFKHELAIMAIMKDEGPYLKEWLDFHILVGVEKFYLYDNGSTDNTMEILKPYIKSGVVELTNFPGQKMQNAAYIDAINKHAYDARWIAEIDLDEFIVPVHTKTIPEFLHQLPQNFGALVLTWVMYGTSGHMTKQDGLVIENYKWRGDRNHESGCKTIINPRFIARQRTPHINDFAAFVIDENGKKLGHFNQTWNPPSFNKIRCNHYVTKSYEEYKWRVNRGSASTGINSPTKKWSKEFFDAHNANDVYDDIMDKYIPLLKDK